MAAAEVGESPGTEPAAEADVYLATLARYVEALGGRLEVRAVFPEETITLLRRPGADEGRANGS